MLSHFSHVWLFVTLWTVVHQAPLSVGILQARIVEWVAMSSSRGSFQPRDRTQVSCIAGAFFTVWATKEALIKIYLSSNNIPCTFTFLCLLLCYDLHEDKGWLSFESEPPYLAQGLVHTSSSVNIFLIKQWISHLFGEVNTVCGSMGLWSTPRRQRKREVPRKYLPHHFVIQFQGRETLS